MAPKFLNQIKKAYEQDPLVLQKDTKEFKDKYTFKDNLVYYQDKIYIPVNPELQYKILHEHHDSPLAGHLGIEKTIKNIQWDYYWPNMLKEIKEYVQSCDLCQRNKSSNQTPAGLLQPLPIPTKKFEQVTMDFIVQLPRTKSGYDAIVVFVDRLTKIMIAEPTTTNATASEIARIFFKTVFY